MKKSILTSTILLFTLTVFCQEIVQWRGDKRDGIYNETGLLKSWPTEGPQLLWHFDQLGPGHASATVTSENVYTAGTIDGNGYIFCFDLDGNLLWKKEYGKEWVESWDGVRTTPTLYNGKLYQMSGYGVIYCLNAQNGEQIWKVDLLNDYDGVNIKWGITENLVIDEGIIYCTPGGKEANVLAIKAEDGSMVWKGKGNGEESAYCSPTVVNHKGKKIFVTQTASHILGIDVANGELLWKFEQPNRYSVHPNTPIYKNGMLYISSGYGKGSVKLKLSDDGTQVTQEWFSEDLDNRMAGVLLLDGKLYGSADKNRNFMVVDWETGKTEFSEDIIKKGNVIFADGLIYFYSQSGSIALIDPNGGTPKIISQFEVPYGEKQHWAHIVIKDKKLYVRHGSSLMVYNIAA